jgi:hypothetical protein
MIGLPGLGTSAGTQPVRTCSSTTETASAATNGPFSDIPSSDEIFPMAR